MAPTHVFPSGAGIQPPGGLAVLGTGILGHRQLETGFGEPQPSLESIAAS